LFAARLVPSLDWGFFDKEFHRDVRISIGTTMEMPMPIILWLLGVPLSLILVLWLVGVV
jgi:hypothetical protein